MRPTLRLLEEPLVNRIVDEARELLRTIGVTIHNEGVLSLLGDHGAEIDVARQHATLTDRMIDQALRDVPRSFRLYDVLGHQTHDFSGENVYFTPGSAAINVLDNETGEIRRPVTADYVKYARVVSGLSHIASQSTALIPADVPEKISDSYRLYLSLLYCEKPVVTGAFTVEAFEIMKELQLAVRGNSEELEHKPLTVFSCCPTAPIKWSDVTSQNVVDCARHGIPVEFISMPLSGFMAPVTLVGTLIQHTAETLSGVVISQLARPGAPVLYGGSPAVFDMRYETTPMGAVESMMIVCAYSQIGRSLGMPTQGYISLSDAKRLDAQAGLESGIGAILAGLAGINNVSGPGMLDFESCQSLEKLVLDNEICGMSYRVARGIEPREDFPALPLFRELLREKHLIISEHTRRHLREEIAFPGPVVDRANRSRWLEEGGLSLRERAAREVARLARDARPSRLSEDVRRQLTELMTGEARKWEMDALPPREG
jgi:trimethylamine--corrinoid protein Co-methyltransferase